MLPHFFLAVFIPLFGAFMQHTHVLLPQELVFSGTWPNHTVIEYFMCGRVYNPSAICDGQDFDATKCAIDESLSNLLLYFK